jgi:hypothetical protein
VCNDWTSSLKVYLKPYQYQNSCFNDPAPGTCSFQTASGQCNILAEGDYPNPATTGLPNDSITAVNCQNAKAWVFNDDNYAGGSFASPYADRTFFSSPPAGAISSISVRKCGLLQPGQSLARGQSVSSCDARFTLAMQTDGNLVLYQGSTPLWASYTTTGQSAIMQTDGNFVLYDSNHNPAWSSNTWGRSNSHLSVQDDGNLVVYAGAQALWSSGTCCR